MSARMSGADLEALAQLTNTLERQGGTLRSITNSATAASASLERLWQGPDGAQFRREWMTVHRPKLMKAADEVLDAAATIERNRQAQESTSASDGPGGGNGGPGIISMDGKPEQPVLYAAGGGEGVPTGDPSETGLEPVSPSAVFSEEYMDDFIGSENQGQNSDTLNQRMLELLNDDGSDPAATEAVLAEIAEIRGEDPAEIRAQYDLYLELAEQRGPIDDLENLDTSFLGTTTSLRYGSVVGDVLGIDPVFAALLNPSGGQVGGGNESYTPGDNDAIGYHGTFHDAAGYLYNHHDRTGPGYDYLGREGFRDTADPTTGQIGGISWWVGNNPELDGDVSQVFELIPGGGPGWAPILTEGLHRVGLEEGVSQVLHIAEGGTDIVQGAGDVLDGNYRDGFGQIWEGNRNITVGTVDNIWDLQVNHVENLVDGGEFVYDTTYRAVDGALDRGEDLVDTAVDTAVDTGRDLVGSVTGLGRWLG